MSDEDAARGKKESQIQYKASIDIGRKNFCAMVSTNPISCPFFVKNVFDGITDSSIWNAIRNPAKDFAATSSYVDLFQKHAVLIADKVISQCQAWNVTAISVGTRGFVKGIVPATKKASAIFLTNTASCIRGDNFDIYFSMEFMNALRFRASFHDITICFIDEKGTSQHPAFSQEKAKHGQAFSDRDLNAAINIGARCFGESFLTSVRDGRQFFTAPVVLKMPISLEDAIIPDKKKFANTIVTIVHAWQSGNPAEKPRLQKVNVLRECDDPAKNRQPMTERPELGFTCESQLSLLVDNPVRIAGCSNVRRGIA